MGIIPHFIKNRVFHRFNEKFVNLLAEYRTQYPFKNYDDSKISKYEEYLEEHYEQMGQDVPEKDYEKAHLVSSSVKNDEDMHLPVLDIDYSAHLEPSSTEGHYHLYLNKKITWEQYQKLLNIMSECGLLESGFVEASINRGYSSVRKPGLSKDDDL